MTKTKEPKKTPGLFSSMMHLFFFYLALTLIFIFLMLVVFCLSALNSCLFGDLCISSEGKFSLDFKGFHDTFLEKNIKNVILIFVGCLFAYFICDSLVRSLKRLGKEISEPESVPEPQSMNTPPPVTVEVEKEEEPVTKDEHLIEESSENRLTGEEKTEI